MISLEARSAAFINLPISVHFPGAVNSKFTTTLSFERPSERPAMPTYRVMDSDGVVVDESRKPLDVYPDEALKWYKDMLTGLSTSPKLVSAVFKKRLAEAVTLSG